MPWELGRSGNPLFHCDDYLAAHPDAAASGINPLVHFVLYGSHTHLWKEGVQFGRHASPAGPAACGQ